MRKVCNQHGDVVFYDIEKIPEGAREIKVENGWIFEHGEGVHTHIFEDVSGIKVYEKDGKTYIKVKSDPKPNHEEHGYQKINPGIKEKGLERVFDYETMEARNVID